MSRYIDAYALDRAFSKLRFNNDGELEHYGDRPNWYLWGSEVENLIADAPSIDIVRCGECEYWKESQYYPEVMVCTYVKGATFTRQHDDFCSRGERKDDE